MEQEELRGSEAGRTPKRKEVGDSGRPTAPSLFQRFPEPEVCGMEEDAAPKKTVR